MSQKIDPREVLTYLNELGYTNINAQQLKDFITDLKKLIKYENKRRQKENTEPGTPVNSVNSGYNQYVHINEQINHGYIPPVSNRSSKGRNYEAPSCVCKPVDATEDKSQSHIFSHLHSQHTVASRAKSISVLIKKPKSKSKGHEHCTHLERDEEQEGDLHVIQNVETISDGSKLYINTESTIRSIDPSSKNSLPSKPSTAKKKSKTSFIRSKSAKSINKCDPVALYHHYQEQWKKQKFPGQENHADIRWATREKMLSGPKVDVWLQPAISRKRCNSWKG